MFDRLSDTRTLVIDDFGQFRQTFKTMLHRLGVQQVDQASNGNEAVKLCMENDYDMIFCDYNLGEGQDGQQVLEELHQRSVLQKGSLFLMVTAETTSAQVMGAIEYRPDAYLTKPFTNEQLGQRLKRLLNKNDVLKTIHDSINKGDVTNALKQCDAVMQKSPTARFSCLRLKSELLEKQKAYDEAMALYKSVVQEQPLLWAMIGIGRLYFKQGLVEKALTHFQQMREDFPQQVSVLDWVAKCQQALGDLEQSEKTLKEAIQISPKSVTRQSTLGEIAQTLEHHDIAQQAYAKTIQEGYHSCLLQPQYYQHYFKNTQAVAATLGERDQKKMLSTTETVAKRMEQKYKNNPGAIVHNLAALASLFNTVGNNSQADHYLSRVSGTLDSPDCRISQQDFQQLKHQLDELDGTALNDKILQKISSRLVSVKNDIEQRQQNEQQAVAINREGMQFARQNQQLEALEKFRQAITLAPYHSNYALNAIQTILLNDAFKNDPALIREARDYLDNISLENSGKRWRLYKKLTTLLPND